MQIYEIFMVNNATPNQARDIPPQGHICIRREAGSSRKDEYCKKMFSKDLRPYNPPIKEWCMHDSQLSNNDKEKCWTLSQICK